MDLYRYIGFEIFVDIVQSSWLTFVSPIHNWKDTYEGIVYQAIKTERGRKKISEILSGMGNAEDDLIGIVGSDAITSLVKCQCWCEKCDSVPMWEIYSFANRAIMIKTTKEKLEQLAYTRTDRTQNYVRVQKVNYTKDNNLDSEIKGILTNLDNGALQLSTAQMFLSKRADFKHEHEWRAFVGGAVNNADLSTYAFPIHVPINLPISSFIEDVIVHPFAPDWYVAIVAQFCSNYQIHFSGKSRLYEFHI